MSYIDREKVVKLLQGKCEFCKKQKDCLSRKGSHIFCWVCIDLPAEDVAPIVRCKDCKHWKTGECFIDYNDMPFSTNADDFCSRGAKMDLESGEGR